MSLRLSRSRSRSLSAGRLDPIDAARPPLALLLPLLLLFPLLGPLLALVVRSSRRELLVLPLTSFWFLEDDDDEGRFRRSSMRLLDEVVVEWVIEEAPRPRGTGAEGSLRPSRSASLLLAGAASREEGSLPPFSRVDTPLRLDSLTLSLVTSLDRTGSPLLRNGVCIRPELSLVSLGEVRLLDEEDVGVR